MSNKALGAIRTNHSQPPKTAHTATPKHEKNAQKNLKSPTTKRAERVFLYPF